MQEPNMFVIMAISTILTALIIAIVFLVVMRVLRRLGVVKPPMASVKTKPDRLSHSMVMTKEDWLLVLVPMPLYFFIFIPMPKFDQPSVWWRSILFLMAYTATCCLWKWLRLRDPASARALRRAKAGDVEAAIADLLEVQERRGPRASRLNTLGWLYLRVDSHDLALKAFGDAANLDAKNSLYRENYGVALLKLGRTFEAEPILRQVCESLPLNRLYRCNYCLALAGLGRWGEAVEQLQILESLPKEVFSSRSAVEAQNAQIQKCRELIVSKKSVSSLDGLDELI